MQSHIDPCPAEERVVCLCGRWMKPLPASAQTPISGLSTRLCGSSTSLASWTCPLLLCQRWASGCSNCNQQIVRHLVCFCSLDQALSSALHDPARHRDIISLPWVVDNDHCSVCKTFSTAACNCSSTCNTQAHALPHIFFQTAAAHDCLHARSPDSCPAPLSSPSPSSPLQPHAPAHLIQLTYPDAGVQGKQGEPQQQPSRSKATDIVSRALEHAAQTLAKTRSEGNLHASASAPATSSGTTITLPSSNPPSTSQPSGNPPTLLRSPL